MPIFSFTMEALYKLYLRIYSDEIAQFTLTPLGIRDPMELSSEWIQREFDRRGEEIETTFEKDLWKFKRNNQRAIEDRHERRVRDYVRLHDWRAEFMDRINGKWEEEDDEQR